MPRINKMGGIGLIDAHVGMRVHKRRVELGITLQELGNLTGVSYQQIQKYENGANRISASMLWLLGAILDATPSYFFEGLSANNRPSLAMRRPEDEGRAPLRGTGENLVEMVSGYGGMAEPEARGALPMRTAGAKK
jgi:transcriptional regulator with XRE-family HTH domain